MNRRIDIIKSPSYWITRIQLALYNCAEIFMKETKKNRTQLAEHLGVTKGYVTQLLNGDYDHKLSKLVELSLAFGYVPKIDFVPVEEYYTQEQQEKQNGFQSIKNQTMAKCIRLDSSYNYNNNTRKNNSYKIYFNSAINQKTSSHSYQIPNNSEKSAS